MSLKLFSPQVSKEVHGAKRDEDIAQVAFLTSELQRLQTRINTENTQWTERLQEQRKLYGDEKEQLQRELRDLTAEIRSKEKRLGELLLPIDGMKERAEKELKEAEVLRCDARRMKDEVEELEERLTNKLDELTEREARLGENEVKVESRLRGIADESKMVSETHTRLNQERAMFDIVKRDKMQFLEERESAINIREKRNQEYIKSREKDFEEQERSLQDRREALNRAFDDIKKLQAKQ